LTTHHDSHTTHQDSLQKIWPAVHFVSYILPASHFVSYKILCARHLIRVPDLALITMRLMRVGFIVETSACACCVVVLPRHIVTNY